MTRCSTPTNGRPRASGAPVEKVDRSQDADLSPWIEAIGRATSIDEFTRAGQKHLTPLVRLDMSGDIPGADAP